MKFKNILSEIFSVKDLDKKDYYKDNAERKKSAPDRYDPFIIQNGLSNLNPNGTIKTPKQNEMEEEVKAGYKRLAKADGGTPTKVKNYLHKLDKEGDTDEIEKSAKKKGLSGKDAEAYKWAVLHKRMKGHFKKK